MKGRPKKYDVSGMEVNEEREFPDPDNKPSRAAKAIYSWGMRHGKKFVCRYVEGVTKVRRTA